MGHLSWICERAVRETTTLWNADDIRAEEYFSPAVIALLPTIHFAGDTLTYWLWQLNSAR